MEFIEIPISYLTEGGLEKERLEMDIEEEEDTMVRSVWINPKLICDIQRTKSGKYKSCFTIGVHHYSSPWSVRELLDKLKEF
jgi:hypothetical protein